MMKRFSLLMAVTLLAGSASVSLAGWSVNNPYRTYNLTGLNTALKTGSSSIAAIEPFKQLALACCGGIRPGFL